MAAEKRKTPRISPFVAPCRILDGDRRLAGYLTDLSSGGARVICQTRPPAQGAAVVLEVRFTHNTRYCRFRAEVRWTRPREGPAQGNAFGLTFTGATPEERELLEAVVHEFQRRARELQ